MKKRDKPWHMRLATAGDEPILREMLFYAARWRPGSDADNRERVLSDDQVLRYVDGWGEFGDVAVIAEEDAGPIGAAWLRRFTKQRPGYGFLSEDIPELGIAVVPDRRGQGVGAAMIREILRMGRQHGYSAISLSVETDNPALRLYERFGFATCGRGGSSTTMRIDLGNNSSPNDS